MSLINQRVRVDLRLDKPEDPGDVWFEGLPMPFEDALDLYSAWHQHGVMAVAGGFLDQPRAWRDILRSIGKVYDALYHKHLPEAEAKIKQRAAKPGQ